MVALVLSLGVANAFAADPTYTITISKDTTDKAAHTYGAFQVFKGKLETVEGKEVLSDIQWGDNITPSATLISAINTALGLTGDDALASDASAAVVAKAISDATLENDAPAAQALADAFNAALNTTPSGTGTIAANESTGTIEGLAPGYYLVKDIVDVDGQGAETRFMLQVVSNVAVTEKASVPTITKKVQEKNDSTGTTAWQDSADYDIGDTIPYQITGTLPSKFAEYDTYKTYTITDTLSAGLTPPAAEDVKVTLDTADGTDLVKNGTFTVSVNGQVITVSLAENVDLKKVSGITAASKFIVTYNATLNENAVIGSIGNPNEVVLEYSNNPNYDGDGDTGTTPKDKVIVFTYKLLTNKLDEDEKTPLKGAGFTLYKWDASQTAEDKYVAVGAEVKGEDMTQFAFTGVDAGQYKLVETTVPAGYNKAADLEFKVVATYNNEVDPPELTALTITDMEGNTLTEWTIDSVKVGEATSNYAQAETGIANHKGSVLPSTGGIGTTIFYVVGGVLVLAAIILLVTKKRMSD